MSDLTITGLRRTELDNNLRITSESVPGQTILIVNPTTNRVGINNNAPTVDLDITGSTNNSSALAVQTNKLIVDSSGRVGVNVTPTTYQFHVVGNTLFSGPQTTITGTQIILNTTSLQIQDNNIVINKNGSDASANGAGITIERTSTFGSLIWNNTSTNFRAGLLGSETALMRDGGNTNAANMSIGTNDAFALNLETNNTTRMSIASTGDITVNQNMNVSGRVTVQGLDVQGFLAPPGTIVQFLPGTFGNGSNGSFTVDPAISLNNAASINAWLVTIGYSQWKVCNGASYNVAGSPLYSGASKFTPNLTDDRFLQGSTVAGSVGGTNDGTHTHTLTAALASVTVAHTHSNANSPNSPGTSVLTSVTPTSGAANPASTSSNPGTSGPSGLGSLNISHSHPAHPHTHGSGSLTARLGFAPGTLGGVFITVDATPTPVVPTNRRLCTPYCFQPASYSSTGTAIVGSSSDASAPYGSGGSSSAPFDHTHTILTHTHSMPHTHNLTAHNHSNALHSHGSTTTTWSVGATFNSQFCHTHTIGSNTVGTENRPQFLACFYLVRVA